MAWNDEYLAAVDIGTTKTVAAIGKPDTAGIINILGYGSASSEEGLKRGTIINIEVTARAIRTAVDKASEMAGIKISGAVASISGMHLKCIVNRSSKYVDSPDNEITQKDVEDLASDMYKIPIEPGEKILHIIPQSYIVDNETGIKNPIGIFGKRLEANFMIVIGQVTAIKNLEKCFARAGLHIIGMVFSPLAAADAILTRDEKEAGVVMVEFGGGTTNIAIYNDEIIKHLAVIPFGGNILTNDIKEGCAILQRQAESLKIQYGSALGDLADENKIVSIPGISGRKPKEISFRNLAYIIQARMEELIVLINKEIGHSGLADKLSAGMVISGGGANLLHIQELISLQTGLDVRSGSPDNFLSDNSDPEVKKTSNAVLAGLLNKAKENRWYMVEKKPEPEIDITQEEPADKSEEKEQKPKKIGFWGRRIKEIMDEGEVQ